MNPSKVLLLDVDGVILNHPRVLEHVGRKVINLVQRTVPGNISMLDANQINRRLYSSYGHTLIGLKTIYKNVSPSINEFNTKIYDKNTINYLHSMKNDPEIIRKSHEVKAVIDKANKHNIPVYLFSNAPYEWCRSIVDISDLSDRFNDESILCSSHPIFQDKYLKPEYKLYQSVQDFLNHQYHDKDINYIFVDDSWSNIMPVIGNMQWTPIHLDNKKEYKIHSKVIKTIHSIGEIMPIL